MSDTRQTQNLPPAEELTPREARDLSARVETAIGAGTVRETARVDGYLDRLQVAGQAPSQAQRDAARQASPAVAAAAAVTGAAQASQRQQQAAATPAQRAARA